MISIWFFVALVVAFFAIHLLRHRYVHATDATEREHMIRGRDAQASGGKRGSGCCH